MDLFAFINHADPTKGNANVYGAGNDVKSVFALQSLLEGSTLAVEVRVTATITMPFVTSSVTPTPEREGPADSIFETGLRTQHPAK
ncbi:hypothetical protein Tco_0812819, partial [Tanacetum coccineum]